MGQSVRFLAGTGENEEYKVQDYHVSSPPPKKKRRKT